MIAAPELVWAGTALPARNKVKLELGRTCELYELVKYCEIYGVKYFRSLCTKLGIIVPIIAC